MKKYTVEEFRKYLVSQDSLGDIHYFLNEDNIDKANEPDEEEEDDDVDYDAEADLSDDDNGIDYDSASEVIDNDE